VNTWGDFEIEWRDAGREPQVAPNPAYPLGIDIDLSAGAKRSCHSPLPYPAKRIGYYHIRCKLCGRTTIVTTAGRADDPRSIKLRCRT
jgi:hypothetical protein